MNDDIPNGLHFNGHTVALLDVPAVFLLGLLSLPMRGGMALTRVIRAASDQWNVPLATIAWFFNIFLFLTVSPLWLIYSGLYFYVNWRYSEQEEDL